MPASSLKQGLLFLLLLLLTVQCARRGRPEGGPLDLEPPQMLSAEPNTMTTEFKADKIRIYFNEFIRLTNVQRQLIISPPMKYFPEIRPQGLPTKFIDILLVDTLQGNTTYTLNFGQSVQDNNESNPLSFFKYVFSTGSYIDSLSVRGNIKDALLEKPENFITVMLYEADSTFNDSTIYKKPPTYITNTLDSLTKFNLENLKPGTYHLLALKDKNNNYLYNQKNDKIAFLNQTITLPTDSTFTLNLFKEINTFSIRRPSQVAKNRYLFGYEGSSEGIRIEILNKVNDSFDYRITKQPDKDTLFYWFKNIAADTLSFKVYQNTSVPDTFRVPLKEMKKDTLVIKQIYTSFQPIDKPYGFSTEIPLVAADSSKVSVVDQDSVAVAFKFYIEDQQKLIIDYPKTENNKYSMLLLPGAFTDFYGNKNDTIKISSRTKSERDYGRLNLNLETVRDFPVLVQLLDASGRIYTEKIAESRGTIDFRYIDPGKYRVRIIHDTNANGKWDTGNWFEKRQPEAVEYFEKTIDLRANWDVFEVFVPKL